MKCRSTKFQLTKAIFNKHVFVLYVCRALSWCMVQKLLPSARRLIICFSSVEWPAIVLVTHSSLLQNVKQF